jgi:hypothetical protein
VRGLVLTAYLVLRSEDVEVTGVVSDAGEVEVLGWRRRGGAPIAEPMTRREWNEAADALWEVWGWCWWSEDEAA